MHVGSVNYSFSLNEIAINNIILDIDNYQRNIKQILNSMADIYKDLSNNTNYNGKQTYLAKANTVAENNKIICINLDNYKADLNKIKTLYKKASIDAADKLNKDARNMYVGTEYRNK